MKLKSKKGAIFLFLAFLVLGFLYLVSVWQRYSFILSLSPHDFGYLDYQNNWRGLDDFVSLKTPFKDYFYEYGWFFLALQSPAYLLFGKNFLAILISREIYLPLLGIIVSFFLAKNILGKLKWVWLFLFLVLLFRVNYDYTSLRHLMGELGLSFLILYFWKKRKIFLTISGFLTGLAILTSLEYGVALNIAIFEAAMIWIILQRKFFKEYLLNFWLPQITLLFPFFFWLWKKGALLPYWKFTYRFIYNFYSWSPCTGESFPRLAQIPIMQETSRFLILGLPIEWLQKVNFYLVILTYWGIIIWCIYQLVKKRKATKTVIILFLLSGYGSIISGRTLVNPCVGYFTYCLIPFFLLLTLGIKRVLFNFQTQTRLSKILIGSFILITLLWFTLTSENEILTRILNRKKSFPPQKTEETKYYPPAGMHLGQKLVENYEKVVRFIQENTREDDYLFVYPWGPYNTLTGRPPASSYTTNFQYMLVGDDLKVKEELEKNQPKLVIINLYNEGGVTRYGTARDDFHDFVSNPKEEGPVFAGKGNEVEWFILENYKTVKLVENCAIIMQKRDVPLQLRRELVRVYSWPQDKAKINLNSLKRKTNNGSFEIRGNRSFLELEFPEEISATHSEISFLVPGNFLEKYLSLFFINVYVKEKGRNDYYLLNPVMVLRRSQKIEFGFTGKEATVEKIKIELSGNKGFIWWLKPQEINIEEINFFRLKNYQEALPN